MKASELRIGNLVYGINRRSAIHLPDNLPLRVWEIGIFNSEVLPMDQSAAETEKWFKITNSDLSPIPLTEEWLMKFCFHKDNYGVFEKVKNNLPYVSGCEIEFWTKKEKDEWDICVGKDIDSLHLLATIKYVHTLQNLYFALTGEELKIESK